MNITSLLEANSNTRRNLNKRKRKVQEVGKNGKGGGGGAGSRDPKTTRVKKLTRAIGGSSGQFEESQVDFLEIERAYYADSYISRAIDNISALMFKSGFNLKSKNPNALDYVQSRIRLIEEATNQSFDSFLTELGDSFVLFGNATFIKVRGTESLNGVQATGYYGTDPIAGVFPASTPYTTIKRDEMGEIEAFQVGTDSGGSGVEFKPEDVGLITYRKPTGRTYGIPYIQNVLNDVLILRQLENNVTRLTYRNLFPLTVYTIGSTTPGMEATDEEIEEAVDNIGAVPDDGIFVVPERHKLETVSNNSAALDVNPYLKYFRQRVFTGLGMSESTMGIGDSTNKSTADNQNSDLNDLVKDFQRRFEAQIQQALINELLFEGGYDPIVNVDDAVKFEFVEIEQGAKMARENHYINLYNNNAIDWVELRANLGYDAKDDMSMFAMNLGSNSQSAQNTTDNINQPENQHGKEDGPTQSQTKEQKKSKTVLTERNKLVNLHLLESISNKDERIIGLWRDIRDDFKLRLSKNNSFEESLGFSIALSKSLISKSIYQSTIIAFENTLNATTPHVLSETKQITDYISKECDKTTERLFISLNKRFEGISQKENPEKYIEGIFGSFEKRIKDITENQSEYGKNIAEAMNLFSKGNKKITLTHKENSCESCKKINFLEHKENWFKSIPPHHPGCNCSVN